MTHARRAMAEVLALGLANGLLLGAGLGAAHPLHGLMVSMGAGTFITLTYVICTRFLPPSDRGRTRAAEDAGTNI